MRDAKTYDTKPILDSAQDFTVPMRVFVIGLMVGLVAGGFFGVGLGWMTAGSSALARSATTAGDGAVAAPVPQATTMADVSVERTLSGVREFVRMCLADAPVKIVMFEDPQCPFCKAAATGWLPQVVEKYVKSGQASVTYRHFAFLGPESALLSSAMECAGQQGQFWAFHNKVHNDQLPENSGRITADVMADWAKSVGVTDASAFKTCLTSPQVQQQLDADRTLGGELGVRGTPTVFVNGKPLVGAVPYDFVANAIEAQLALARTP
jgi:protein-disulfide isomerase